MQVLFFEGFDSSHFKHSAPGPNPFTHPPGPNPFIHPSVSSKIVDANHHTPKAKAGQIIFVDPLKQNKSTLHLDNLDCIDPVTGQVVKANTTINRVTMNSKSNVSHINGKANGR